MFRIDHHQYTPWHLVIISESSFNGVFEMQNKEKTMRSPIISFHPIFIDCQMKHIEMSTKTTFE